MKLLFTILFLFLCNQLIQAQNYVFVLVDVSKSVTQNQLTDAKQALNEVLTGSNLSKAFVTQGKQQDLVNFKLVLGDKLAVTKFGSLQTTLAISPNPTQIQNIPADVNPVLNSISWIPIDGQTYITLAKAKIAEYAKNHQIAKYKLYIISDNINDNYGPGGKPNYIDDYTRNLAEGYNSSTNQVGEAGYTKIKFSATSPFTLSFSPLVDVSKYNLPNQPPVTIDTANEASAIIKITSNPGGKKDKEIELKSDNLNVNWTCSNNPQGGKFTVIISEYDGGKYREIKKDLLSGFNIKLPDGKFKITVSAQNFSATSDYTYVIISTSGFGWLIALLLIAAAAGTGYYFWNKKRQRKIDVFVTNNNADDIFSKGGSSSNTASNSSNSDYF